MTTYTRATQFITVSRARSATLPIQWKDPAGAPINIGGFQISSTIRWSGVSFSPVVTVVDATAGKFTLSWTAGQVATLPADLSDAEIAVLLVDTGGAAHDFIIPIFGAVP